jgi:two-component system sensor kinase FixL
MTAQKIAVVDPISAVPIRRILDALARIHRWILVLDEQRHVLWLSEPLRELPGMGDLAVGVDARSFLAKLPKPEQVFPLRSGMRERSQLTGSPLELRMAGGRVVPVDIDVVRVDSTDGDLLVVIATEHTDVAGDGIDARLLDVLSDAVLAVDSGGFVRRANPAALRLLEVSADQVIARSITALLAKGADQIDELASALQGAPRKAIGELTRRARSGRVQTLEVAVSPLSAGARAVVLRDVTERRAVEGRLRKANEELEHCIGAIAHDLRSPLVGLLGFSRLLRQDYEDSLDQTGHHFLDRIEQAARTMEALIHDLLELARIGESGERPVLVDPREVLLQLSAELKPRLEAAGIELALPSNLVSRVFCDRSRLYQLFSNLIGNAIDHMGAQGDGRIEVLIDEDERQHEIVVVDNGRGIDPAHHERIFEVFQSIGTRSDGRRGTGMGLAIVKKIVERRGGRIWVESEPGCGARFHLTLPRR